MTNVSADPSATRVNDPRRPWAPPPFTRLARTHALSVAGDTLFTAAMAGTVFFSVADFDEAKGRVALLLLLTVAPFAVAAPLLGPALDRARGGRRWMIFGLAVARAVLCVLIIRDLNSNWFYLEALGFLVLSRGYLISRGAVVPTTVRDDSELVTANSRLALLSGVSAVAAAGPAVLMLWLGSPALPLAVAAVVFVACAIAATQLPPSRVAVAPPDPVERAELRSAGILVAASSMAAIRLIVGFLVFSIGFYAKDNDQGLLIVGAAIAAQVGFLTGSASAPALRRAFAEERILAIMLTLTVVTGLLAALVGLTSTDSAITLGVAASLLSLGVGITSNVGKQAFDAIVQRDAPDANRGRSFARFETRFQLVWVVGALIGTLVNFTLEFAFVFVAAVAAFALLSYLVGRQRAQAGQDYRLVRLPRAREVLAARVARRRRVGSDDAPPFTAAPRARSRPPGPPGASGSAAVPGVPAGGPGLFGQPDQPLPDDLGLAPPPELFTPGAPTAPVGVGGGGSLDPRRVLDPSVPIAESGVEPPAHLGFLNSQEDTLVMATPQPSGPPRRRRRRLRRRKSPSPQLPGFGPPPPPPASGPPEPPPG